MNPIIEQIEAVLLTDAPCILVNSEDYKSIMPTLRKSSRYDMNSAVSDLMRGFLGTYMSKPLYVRRHFPEGVVQGGPVPQD